MAEKLVGGPQRFVVVEETGAIEQASVNADTVVAGSEIDARPWASLSYTIAVATNGVTWTVFGANSADYSDEVAVNAPANVAAAAVSSYAVAQAPYAYYRVKILSTVPGSHGVATVAGLAKQ